MKSENKKYQIKPLVWLVKDEASVKFHVKNDDYFGTIATILSLIEQQIKKNDCKNIVVLKKTLKTLGEDLMFLQKNYQINPKNKNKNKKPKGRLQSQ